MGEKRSRIVDFIFRLTKKRFFINKIYIISLIKANIFINLTYLSKSMKIYIYCE